MHLIVLGTEVEINMFKIQVLVVACIAAAVVAKPPPSSADLEKVYNTANEALESIDSEAEIVKDIEQVKISLQSVSGAIKNHVDNSLNEALENKESVARTEEDDNIIEKMKKCLKQIKDKGKDKAQEIVEEFKRIISDISKIKQCKGSKEEKEKCTKNVIASIKKDINDLKDKGAEQIQWLINDVLLDFYTCVIAK